MSELSDLTGGGLSGAVPGYKLHRLTNTAIGEVEAHLQRWHVEKAVMATTELAPSIRKDVIAEASAYAGHYITYDTPTFRRRTYSAEGRLLTIKASIGIGLPKFSEADVRAKVDAMGSDTLDQAVDWCWGRDAPPGSDDPGKGSPVGTAAGGT